MRTVIGASQRWTFGDYIVYSSDRYTARRIYECALARKDDRNLFGYIQLDDGAGGNWVKLPGRSATTLLAAGQKTLR